MKEQLTTITFHTTMRYCINIAMVLVFLTYNIQAQVGINTTNPSDDAMLDISSTDKGVLIPRVNIEDLTTIAPITGGTTESLLVYNTNTITGKGFYYWDGAAWQLIGDNANNEWSILGNAGTSPYIHFLGTTDRTDVVFRTNNIEVMRLANSRNVGIGEPSPLSKLTVVQSRSTAGGLSVSNTSPSTSYDTARFINAGRHSAVYGENTANHLSYDTVIVGDFLYSGSHPGDHIGVRGRSVPSSGYGIGVSGFGGQYGVIGQTGAGGSYAVFAQGNSGASGSKTFLADHPLDPANKLLRHFSIESNEVTNMYRGIVQLDASGSAQVFLPDYFSKINIHPSYQLTAVGTASQPYISKEIQGNVFTVAGAPNSKVSWTVWAQRNDAFMQLHPESTHDVVLKKPHQRGKYVTPAFYGKSKKLSIFPTHEKKGE